METAVVPVVVLVDVVADIGVAKVVDVADIVVEVVTESFAAAVVVVADIETVVVAADSKPFPALA